MRYALVTLLAVSCSLVGCNVEAQLDEKAKTDKRDGAAEDSHSTRMEISDGIFADEGEVDVEDDEAADGDGGLTPDGDYWTECGGNAADKSEDDDEEFDDAEEKDDADEKSEGKDCGVKYDDEEDSSVSFSGQSLSSEYFNVTCSEDEQSTRHRQATFLLMLFKGDDSEFAARMGEYAIGTRQDENLLGMVDIPGECVNPSVEILGLENGSGYTLAAFAEVVRHKRQVTLAGAAVFQGGDASVSLVLSKYEPVTGTAVDISIEE